MRLRDKIDINKSKGSYNIKGDTVAGVCSRHGFWRGSYCPDCISTEVNSPQIALFTPVVYRDICETPILVTSKRQLRELCKKHNVKAARLQ